VTSKRYSREKALQALSSLYDAIEAFDGLDSDDQPDEAAILVRSMLRLVSGICGDDIIRMAYAADPKPEDRRACLSRLAERLMIVSHLFSSQQPMSGSSLVDAALDASMVANGDRPKLFAPIASKQGVRTNSFELALHQIGALAWVAYLEGSGIKSSESQSTVASAYGTSADTMRKWVPNQLAEAFGVDVVDLKIRTAMREGAMHLKFGIAPDLGKIQTDGAAYMRALGFKG